MTEPTHLPPTRGYPFQIQVGPNMFTAHSDEDVLYLLSIMSRDAATMAAENLAATGKLTEAVQAALEETARARKHVQALHQDLEAIRNGGLIAAAALAVGGLFLYRQVSTGQEAVYRLTKSVNRTRRAVDAVQRSLENHDARVTDLARPQRG